MTLTCEYCQSAIESGALKCPNCSAPNNQAAAVADYRHCPFCRRKLLALGSPACSYCGRRLPEEFIKAREADLQRINDLQPHKTDPQLDAKVDEILRQTTRNPRHDATLADIFNLGDLTDLFK